MKSIYRNKVEFRLIPGYTNYYISADGRVYSAKRDIIMKVHVQETGYHTIGLTNEETHKFKCYFIHRLVALCWLPLPDGYTLNDVLYTYRTHKLCVDHIDGNKGNNKLENLRWCTSYQNVNYNNFNRNINNSGLFYNTNAVGHEYNPASSKRYIYHLDNQDFKLKELCYYLNCTKSKITESFRRNLGLVKSGRLTRSEIIK